MQNMRAEALAILTALISAAAAATGDHVRTDVRGIPEGARTANHVVVVNVDGALAAEAFGEAATYALSKVNVNAWTNAAAAFRAERLVGDPTLLQRMFGDKAKVGVFLERAGAAPRFLAVPGMWCRVNVDGLGDKAADAQTYKDRAAKMILKGLAYAAGCGASLDVRCSMYYGGGTMEGLDKVGIRLSPGTYFPMLEQLKRVGGDEIVTRQE